jgi:hypothetical protein
MASSYFTLPSFARAKKNTEELEKTNPQQPILKDEDEKFLNKQITTDDAAQQNEKDNGLATQISDDGQVKEVPKEEAGGDVVVPETQPNTSTDDQNAAKDGDGAQDEPEQKGATESSQPGAESNAESADAVLGEQSYDDKLAEKAAEAKQPRKAKKDRGMGFPSQEEAEAATRGFSAEMDKSQQDQSQSGKRTWASYLPTVRPGSRKGAEGSTQQASEEPKDDGADSATQDSTQDQSQRTWTQYASSYVPTSWTTRKQKKPDPDSEPHPVYNEDGTINEAATSAQSEQEVSVLLDNLNMSSINNRVFPLTEETQKLYTRFAQCLKDVINGAPTAYEDMDKLMREAGPKLEEQYAKMPPFVQTLVKSLPSRLGGIVGPEILAAAAAEKPGNDMKARMEKASQAGGTADGSLNMGANTMEKRDEAAEGDDKKGKKKVPGMKSLVGNNSAVAGMLRSVVNFLQTRFPFLASTTNVVMSLAVFSKFLLLYGLSGAEFD